MPRAKLLRPVILLLVVALIWRFAGRRAPEDPRLVKGSGTVEATEIGVAAQASGRLTRLLVEEGDVVAAGQVLAELDQAVLAAEAQRAAAAVQSARWRLANLVRGSRSEEIRARAAQVREALAAGEGAQRQARLARDAVGRPPELKSAADAAEAQFRASGAAVEQAKAALAEARAGSRPQEVAAVKAARAATGAAVETARTALAQAEAAARAAQAQVAEADAAVEGGESDLAQAQQVVAERRAATTQVAAAQTQVETTQAALAAAKARQELVEADPRVNRREQLHQQLAAAQAQAALAESEATRQRDLFASGAVAKRVLDQAQTVADQARAAVRQAQAALRDLEVGARDMERREAAALVAQAQAANKGAETALGNARHEQAILVTAAQQQLDRARTALNQARQRRAQAAAGLDGAKERGAQAATAVAQAGHLATQSQAQLDLVLAGTRAERLAQAAAAVQLAEATHAGAGQALGNARQALADRFAYRAQVAATEAQASGSRARLDAAQAALDLALAGNTNEVIEAARADLRQAVAAEGVARARLADTVIRAPASATISEIILRQGEGCTPGSVIVRMLDLKHLWVRIYLPVPALERIRLGQPCTVAADAFPAKRFPGKVLTCSPQAEFTPKNTQTVDERVKQVFWVKVDIGDGQGVLKPGVPVDVTVTTTDHQP